MIKLEYTGMMISWDDFKKQKKILNFSCEETNVACPKCGAAIWKDIEPGLSYPPKHRYMCLKCRWMEWMPPLREPYEEYEEYDEEQDE